MEALVHDQPHMHRTFAQCCRKAFVIGTSFEHYQCWRFWLTSTRATHISGAAFFKHKYITSPYVTPEDRVIAVAQAIAKTRDSRTQPNLHPSPLQSLTDLQHIFQQAATAYNAYSTTHRIPDDPPRVAVVTPPPSSPATPPRVARPTLAHPRHLSFQDGPDHNITSTCPRQPKRKPLPEPQ